MLIIVYFQIIASAIVTKNYYWQIAPNENKIIVIENEDYDKEIQYIADEINENRDVFIVPTYTSLMDQRDKIVSKFGGKEQAK